MAQFKRCVHVRTEGPALPRRSPGVVIATAGMQADYRTLHKTLQARAVQYQFAHQRPINVGAAAQMLSNTLYNKRFFPYYAANLCVGLDPQGEPWTMPLNLCRPRT